MTKQLMATTKETTDWVDENDSSSVEDFEEKSPWPTGLSLLKESPSSESSVSNATPPSSIFPLTHKSIEICEMALRFEIEP
jgi:hypothetical protein